jgi:cytochrome P450
LGDGIFNVDGELWRQHRKAAAHLFATRKLRQFQEVAFQRDANLLASILKSKIVNDSSKEFDLQALFSALTFDSFW